MELRGGEKEVSQQKNTGQSSEKNLMEVDVAAVVFAFDGSKLRVLGEATERGTYTLPRYVFESGMSLKEAAQLAAKRAANIQVPDFFQVGAFSDPNAGSENASPIEVCFFGVARAAPEDLAQAEQQGSASRWIELEDLSQFETVSQSRLQDSLAELRRRARFESIVFSFLPEEFSLSELQKVFEAILGKTIDVRNFRKKIEALNILVESPNKPRGMAYRPPRLFSFNRPRYDERVTTEGEVRFY